MPSINAQKLTVTSRIPTRATDGSAGFDLYLNLPHGEEFFDLDAGCHAVLPTGVALMIPPGYVGLVCPRSGLSARQAITVHNGPGVIDHDYRGEIGVILHNSSQIGYRFTHGDKIAQLVVVPALHIHMIEVDTVSRTERGDGAYGSTGA